ncbi:PP2C family protein-serine/threonine phosphatase [Actinoplanes sp. NPDC023936]|uniref:PP2C family protein-serine/threonine phosphatase n=1 Tax=Actinoplanes sp. NPDC023936 TaxID=3154910 RepID=UPI0033DB8021
MDQQVDLRLLQVLGEMTASSHLMQADQVAPKVDQALSRLGMNAMIYLIDHEQLLLNVLPVAGRQPPSPIPVDDSVPGRSYMLVRPEPDPEHPGELWVPLLDGTERFGVIRFALPDNADPHDPGWQQRCELIAGLTAHLVQSKLFAGDILPGTRRTQPMTVAAELMWQMLPPLTSSHERLALTAIIEPCYDIGGDGYDYAVNGDTAWLVLLDAMGRGLTAAVACAVALSAIRATRRAGGGLIEQVRAADENLVEQFGPTGRARFVTGLLAKFDLETGLVRYINAGNPLPVILRDADLLGVVTGGARVPLGLRTPADMCVGEQQLQRGDRMLLHTDGVIEARATDGSPFGAARLTQLATDCEKARLPAPETLRRLSLAVAEHRGGPPSDDAAMVLVEWSPTAAKRTLVGPPVPATPGEGEDRS